MKRTCLLLGMMLFAAIRVFAQSNPYPIVFWGPDLDGANSNFQRAVFYAGLQSGLLFEAPLDASGNKLPIQFQWRGGTHAMTITGDGNMGIGTATPAQKLHVNGNGKFNGLIISTKSDPNIGGTLLLENLAKTANGTANAWAIYNMGGVYGNSLQFWAYDNVGCSGGLCRSNFTLMDNGNVGIGTTNPQARLAVNGDILTHKIKVSTNASLWPDYVFEKTYKLPSLQHIEQYISENKHLPDMPSAATVEKDGHDLAEMDRKLLQKVEELTLHMIRLDKENQQLKAELQTLKKAQAVPGKRK